jgi:hypothetical protein
MIESEKVLEAKLRNLIKKNGGWCIKLPAVHVSGLPDRMCLLPTGRIFFAEIKTTYERPSAVQRIVHKRFAKLGFPVAILDTTEKIKQTIERYVEKE